MAVNPVRIAAAKQMQRATFQNRPRAVTAISAAAALAAICVLLPAGPAFAWVCARTQDGNNTSAGPAIGWRTRSLTYAFNASGTDELSTENAFNTLRQSFAVWEYSQLRSDQTDPTCSAYTVDGYPNQTDVFFTELPATDANNVGYNYLNPDGNENILVFRDFSWPHQAADEPTSTGDIIALTTTTYNQLTGEIFDSDIEFNSARFTFTTGDVGIQTDLMNTATHEIGHFLGFAHSDDPNATMFFSASGSETIKRYLSCDDAAILWFRYPAGDPNQGMCDPNNVLASCGYCQPPTALKFNPHVSVLGTNAGLSQAISCQTVPGAGFLWVAAAAAARVQRRRRSRGMVL